MDSTCLSTSIQRSGARALGNDAAASGAVRVLSSRQWAAPPTPRRLSEATSPLGCPCGALISTVSFVGGRLLPLPAARLRRHTLRAIRAKQKFPWPSCCFGAPSFPPPATAFAVDGLRPPAVRSVTSVRPSARGAGLRGRPAAASAAADLWSRAFLSPAFASRIPMSARHRDTGASRALHLLPPATGPCTENRAQ